jgi:ferric-dicitrate binding protein FerR (iron transport regulator)
MSELDLRASDRDRDRVVDELRAHGAEGRLTVEELEERVRRALAARTLGELAELTRDLPDHGSPARPARRRRSGELRVFLGVAVLLIAIWALTGAGYFWPVWPLVGWGFFVLAPRKALGFPACHPSGSSRR